MLTTKKCVCGIMAIMEPFVFNQTRLTIVIAFQVIHVIFVRVNFMQKLFVSSNSPIPYIMCAYAYALVIKHSFLTMNLISYTYLFH